MNEVAGVILGGDSNFDGHNCQQTGCDTPASSKLVIKDTFHTITHYFCKLHVKNFMGRL